LVDLLPLAAGAKVEESCQLLTVDAFLVDADLVGMSQVSVSELLLSVELFYLIVINFDVFLAVLLVDLKNQIVLSEFGTLLRATDVAYLIYLLALDPHDPAGCFIDNFLKGLDFSLIVMNEKTNPVLRNVLCLLYLFALRDNFLFEGGIQYIQAVRLLNLAFCTNPVVALLAFEMIPDIDIVIVVSVAFVADEWFKVWLILFMIEAVALMDDSIRILYVSLYALV
jgi:hypothetical protein